MTFHGRRESKGIQKIGGGINNAKHKHVYTRDGSMAPDDRMLHQQTSFKETSRRSCVSCFQRHMQESEEVLKQSVKESSQEK